MLKVIRSLLLKIVDDIDAGNSNITEGEAIEIVDNLRRFTDKEKSWKEVYLRMKWIQKQMLLP